MQPVLKAFLQCQLRATRSFQQPFARSVTCPTTRSFSKSILPSLGRLIPRTKAHAVTQRRSLSDEKKPSPTIHLGPPPSSRSSASQHPIQAAVTPEQVSVSRSEPIPELKTKEETHKLDEPVLKSVSNAKLESRHAAAHHDCPDPAAHDLPSTTESRRSQINKRFTRLMDRLQGDIVIGAQRINDLTGYSGIEELKNRISSLEERLEKAQEDVRLGRIHYKETIANRAASQREVNSLLSRKETWMPNDVERFTSLYRSDHGNEVAVQEAATKLSDAERAVEKASSTLSASILSRYHEEQIWSDKIRRMSTWGTWGLMGVNAMLFLLSLGFQFGLEPWRRARLVRGVEEKVRELLEREKFINLEKDAAQAQLADAMDETEAELPIAAAITAAIDEIELEMEAEQLEVPPIDQLAEAMNSETGELEESIAASVSETEPETMPEKVMVPARDFDWREWTDWHDWISSEVMIWRETIMDLFSGRIVTHTQQDVTIIALNSAASGAAFVGMIVMLFSNSLRVG